jgi:hypothetical protein
MGTNAIVLLAVTALAAVVLAGAIALVVAKTRTSRRSDKGATFRGQIEEDVQELRRQEVRADRSDAKAHAAQIEIDIKTIEARNLKREAMSHRKEAVDSRERLAVQMDSADKLGAAAQPPNAPGLAE